MTNHQDNYLWDPSSQSDVYVAQLEQLLKPLSANALNLANRKLPLPPVARTPLRWKRWIPLAAAATFAGIYFTHVYRLSWTDGSPWPVAIASNGTAHTSLLRVGESITTMPGQTATLSAARIGKVVVSPDSAIRLVQTGKGKHRIELEHGRLHAKIWAPPNYFGVTHREARFNDMGCEFDLSIESTGKGTLSVTSGWVIYWHNHEGLFVPENYLLSFNDASAQTPVRVDAADTFREWVTELETQLGAEPAIDQPRVIELTQKIADGARDEDYFTLLTLLGRYPQLAQGPLYPRLALTLKINADDELQRARWSQGDLSARDEWWRKLPKQPKQPRSWWLNWRDAF